MPIYTYECQDKKCQHVFETVQGIRDNALKKCPVCSRMKLERIIGNIGVSFKGTGFPGNDMKNKQGDYS
jgi:putative FmdB family regulatory protein